MKWEMVKFDDIADFYSGNAWSAAKFCDTGKIPIIRIQNFGDNPNESFVYWNDDYDEKNIVREGDLLLSLSGSIKVKVWNRFDALLNQRIVKIVPKKNIDKQWFYWQIHNVLDKITKLGKWALVNNVSISDLKDFVIPLPPLPEQKRIAAILDKADALRRKDGELLKKYDELAQSIFIDMFGDPVKNEKGWEVKKLGEICTKITDGTHDTPARLRSGIKFITGKHIRPYLIDYDNSDYVTEEVHSEIYRRCNPEFRDILYTNIGVNYATAAMNIVTYEFSMKNVALLKYNRSLVYGRYLEYLLNNEHFKNVLRKQTDIGGAQQFLSLGQINFISIPIPSLELQKRFEDKIEFIINIKNKSIPVQDYGKMLFQSLLQQAFKGEL